MPLASAVAGVLSLALALFLLRSIGPRFRIGRLLSAAPEVSIEEARELAAGRAVYVRVNGRVTSDEEFPDENDRPLVYRRTRVEVQELEVVRGRTGRLAWRSLVDEREAVPFGVESRSAYLAIDDAALGDGLVAIPRQSDGVLADLPPDLVADAPDLPRDTPARLRIEQLSAVEHVTAVGRPKLRDGEPVLTAGLGRPLIVTSLDGPAAMRLLASGARGRVVVAALLTAAGLALLALAVGALLAIGGIGFAAPVYAASPLPPTPQPSPILVDPLDPRAGAGANLIGAPLLALLVVLGAGVVAAVATFAYVRVVARR